MKNKSGLIPKKPFACLAAGIMLIGAVGVSAGTPGMFGSSANVAYAAISGGNSSVQLSGAEEVAAGVTYQSFLVETSHGLAAGHLITVDLSNPNTQLDLLHPEAVAMRKPVSEMADQQQAVAGINGDFFNISSTQPGVPATNSSVGPEIADGEFLKAAVPGGQRFGPGLPPGTSTWDVFGLGIDGHARVTTLELDGQVKTQSGQYDLDGLNQYALPVNGIGVYTYDWGTASRVRPTCGTDTNRSAPCSSETVEVTVQNGVVTAVNSMPGSGEIPDDTVVLIGRENGADELSSLHVGDKANIDYHLTTKNAPIFKFAVGGFPILRDDSLLAKLDDVTLAPRSSAGASQDGKHVYLAVVDGRSAGSAGMTVHELAELLQSFGASDAVNLDGGGSSTLVARQAGEDEVTVRNAPSDGTERAVANGIGVFVR